MQPFEVLLPCAVKPVGVVLVGEVGDEEGVGAGERASLHAYLHEYVFRVVVPVETYSAEPFLCHKVCLALFVVPPFLPPSECEFVAVGGHGVGEPVGISVGSAYKFPHDVRRSRFQFVFYFDSLLRHQVVIFNV